MKNIFIAGVARSGKSTLAKKLKEGKEYNHIPLDYFTSSLKHNFPDTKIVSNVVIDPLSSKNLSLLLSRVIEIMNNQEEKFIIDSAHVLPQDIIKYLDKDKWDIYFVGYPNIPAEEKLAIIRKYDNEFDWTFKKSDEELLDILEQLIELSKDIESECKKHNINFIDTSESITKSVNEIN
ncbi:MAG: hypothetical protein IJA94_03045 [Bacilli bacterium]|nr:hypothetical protein [Bacilli bacterium]